MSKYSLAVKIAKKTGGSIQDALRLIDDVGQKQARKTLDETEDSITWKAPATAGAVAGGGYLINEQQTRKKEASANEEEADSQEKKSAYEAWKDALDDENIDDKQAMKLADMLFGNKNNDDGGDGGGDWLPDLPDIDIKEAVILLLLLMLVASFASNYISGLGGTIGQVAAGAANGAANGGRR